MTNGPFSVGPHWAPWLRRLNRAMRFLATLGLAVVGLWMGGLAWFASALPESVEDPETPTDLIVVLTGGSERLKTGLALLDAEKGKTLLVSGVYPETTLRQLLDEEPPHLALLSERIVLGHVASDTVGNAEETAQWMRQHGAHSVRLVTASYHMPRSLLEFRAVLPPAVTIIAHPVFPSAVRQDAWWKFPGTAALIAREYSKYLMVRLRLLILGRPQMTHSLSSETKGKS